ncbi:tyrosine-type recombinase/integrase [Deinococcus pimensis]|uniref:tyrosine-type recombinase/integrase n=1 Tax=Deinococcus pimensis TaxID=309888 RepID=UPI0004844F11|nr:tyrosine-type recombinase/integrase [Deinococcus pimensis]
MTLDVRRDSTALAARTDEALRVDAVRATRDYDHDLLATLVEAYLKEGSKKGSQGSPLTAVEYKRATRRYTLWAQGEGVTLTRPGRRTGGRYLAHLQGQQLQPATVAKLIAGARALYRALRWAGATDTNPFEDVTPPADPTPAIEKRPPYDPDVLEAVLAKCGDPYERALLLLTAHAGLRLAEALALRPRDVQRGVAVVHGKGGKRRRVPLSRRLQDTLGTLPAQVARPGFVLPYKDYWQAARPIRLRFKQAGYIREWRGFHGARKAAGTRLYTKVGDFTRVGLFLGHASVDTTRRYVKVEEHDVATHVLDF